MITVAVAMLAPGCVEIDGGAVELSWALRDFDGQPNDCQAARIETIRICWQPLGDGGLPDSLSCEGVRTDAGLDLLYRSFDCEQNRGVTRFEVPPGPTALFVAPLCVGSAEPTGRLTVPPPIVRTVSRGEVVTLNQILIEASNATCMDTDCTCP